MKARSLASLYLAWSNACRGRRLQPLALDFQTTSSLAATNPQSCQVPALENPAAKSQLLAAAGKTLVFHTGLCVLHSATGHSETVLVPTTVEFRRYSEREIERYLELEPALDCAGSFKSEGLGISLCARITSDDPTALIGLPLVALNKLLARFGANPLD